MPGAGTVQPAALARGLRRVALEQGIAIHERTTATTPGDAPRRHGGWGRVPSDHDRLRRGLRRARCRAGRGRDQRLGGRLAPGRRPAGHVVELHGRHRADPGSSRRDRLDRRRGHRRRAVHAPLRPDDAGWPDRPRRRRRAGRLGRSDRAARSPTTRLGEAGRRGSPALVSEPGRCPDRGRVGRPDRHHRRSPAVVRDATRRPRSTTAWATAATASRRRSSAVGSWRRSRPVGPATTRTRACRSSATGATPRAFPPEPLRGVGARLFRAAMVRREAAEEAGRAPSPLIREITRIPRRLGYHLGPE